jgi:uncharacterized membrane protein
MDTFISNVSQSEFPIEERVSGKVIRKTIIELIKKDVPEFTANSFLSISELNFYREKYISEYLLKEIGELSELEDSVLDSLKKHSLLSDRITVDSSQDITFGQKIADKVASFGGSWTFIISFAIFIIIWININIYWFLNKGFDPYPFILLNLILSCLAALQAPVIMMSQNRQEEKDRDRAKKDYMINLKSELEIRVLHEKIDHLMMHQQKELIDIQNVQLEMMNKILVKMKE